MKPLLISTVGVVLLTARIGFAQTAICHAPPGSEGESVTVDDHAVPGHLEHGDCLGDCPCVSTCSPRSVVRVHANHTGHVFGNARLARIEHGLVACLHVEHASQAGCVFTRRSGAWVETTDGHYALAGQSISLDGHPGGEYVVAARVSQGGTVPCVEPTSRDTVGTAAGQELAWSCTLETMLSPSNFNTQWPLANYASREVCTSSNPHPDGAQFTRMIGNSYCYIGAGAALNDSNGMERDATGAYLPGGQYCHTLHNGSYEVPAAKRPATTGIWPLRLNINSPVLWRPVATSVAVAN